MRSIFQTALLVGSLTLAAFSHPAAAANLIVNGDFTAGSNGFTSDYTNVTGSGIHDNGQYYIVGADFAAGGGATAGYQAVVPCCDDWIAMSVNAGGKDGAGTPNGNVFMAGGAGNAGTVVWSQTIAVQANTTYTFSYFGMEVDYPLDASNPAFVASFNGSNSSVFTPDNSGWQKFTTTWDSGSATTLLLSITDTNLQGAWNDFAIDNLTLTGPAMSAVPEPSTWAMMILGFVCVGFTAYRRRNAIAINAA